jgi:capsular polysaccharide biosynthesis protein
MISRANAPGWIGLRGPLWVTLDWLRSPRSRWSAPALAAIAAAALASLWQTVWPPLYTATARIVVDPSAAGASGAAAEWIATQTEIVRSDRVAHRVAADLAGAEPAASPLAHLSVEAAAGSGVIAVRYASVEPLFASQVADAFVAAYERVSREMQAAAIASMKDRARVRLAALRDEAEQARLRLEAADRMQSRDVPNLVKAVRGGSLGPLEWSGLPGEQKGQGRSNSLLASNEIALGGALLEAPTAPAALQDARTELEQAQRAIGVAQARVIELDGDGTWERPTMLVLNRARDSVEPPTVVMRASWLYALVALLGLASGWVLRALARRLDRRVMDAQDLARTGLAVFGVLAGGAQSPRSPRVIPAAARRSWVGGAGTAPALP